MFKISELERLGARMAGVDSADGEAAGAVVNQHDIHLRVGRGPEVDLPLKGIYFVRS